MNLAPQSKEQAAIITCISIRIIRVRIIAPLRLRIQPDLSSLLPILGGQGIILRRGFILRRERYEDIIIAVSVGGAGRVDSLETLQGVGLELDEAGVEGGGVCHHLREEVVDLAVGSYIVAFDTNVEESFRGAATKAERITYAGAQGKVCHVFVGSSTSGGADGADVHERRYPGLSLLCGTKVPDNEDNDGLIMVRCLRHVGGGLCLPWSPGQGCSRVQRTC